MLEFKWIGKKLIIKQCHKMKTSPKSCIDCRHRFLCYTEREKQTDAEVSSEDIPELIEIMKEMEKLT